MTFSQMAVIWIAFEIPEITKAVLVRKKEKKPV